MVVTFFAMKSSRLLLPSLRGHAHIYLPKAGAMALKTSFVRFESPSWVRVKVRSGGRKYSTSGSSGGKGPWHVDIAWDGHFPSSSCKKRTTELACGNHRN